MTESYPFNLDPGQLSASTTARIKSELEQHKRPWDDNAAQLQNPELRMVYRIIRKCWDQKPQLRPTAAVLAQELFDIITSQAAEFSSVRSDEIETAKKVVMQAIEKARSKHKWNDGEEGSLIDRGVQLLKGLGHSLDPTISFLIGASIYWEISPPAIKYPETYFQIGEPLEGTLCPSILYQELKLRCV